jgi:hypothetical protein
MSKAIVIAQLTQWKKKSKRFASAAGNGAAFEGAARGLDAVRAAKDGASRLLEVAEQFQNTTSEQLAGRVAEELHATTFNIDAASKGLRGLRATTTAANGAGTAAADIVITNNGIVTDAAQVKYHGTPAATTFHIADTKYDGMQRIVPADQKERVQELARKRGVDALGKRNYPDVAENASDRIRSGGAESKPLTLEEVRSAAKNAEKVASELIGKQMAEAVKNGAINGALVGGGVSALSNLIAYARGKKSGKDAVTDTLKDTVTCGVSGAAVSGATLGAETLLIRAGAGTLARGSAPVAIGLTVVNIGKDVGRLVTGEIDAKEFALKAAGNVAKGGATWAGMEAGAAVGTMICPGLGTVLGGVLGGIAGGVAGEWLFD